MISKYKYRKLEWIDVEKPSREELRQLAEEYGIPSLVTDDLLTETIRSKVDRYDDCIFMVLHFPALAKNRAGGTRREVDFVIGKNFLITVHYESVDALHDFAKTFEAHSTLDKSPIGSHAGFLFFFVIRELYRAAAIELDVMDKNLIEIEQQIFEGNEEKMVKRISDINRSLLDFRQALRFHHEILQSFEKAGSDFFGADFSYYLSSITGEYVKIRTIMESHKETLVDLHDTNDSLLSAKTNDTIKTLTIMNFIMLPLGLITWVFGMTTKFPLIQTKGDFYLVLGVMALTGLIMFIYFKTRKWL